MPDREALSDRGVRGALQAAHESLADYPAIVAMHEEQTERAEGERDRLRAENERLRGDVVRAIQKQEELRSTVRRMARFAVDAHDLMTPGMKAGVGEARAALQACVELARASDEQEATGV